MDFPHISNAPDAPAHPDPFADKITESPIGVEGKFPMIGHFWPISSNDWKPLGWRSAFSVIRFIIAQREKEYLNNAIYEKCLDSCWFILILLKFAFFMKANIDRCGFLVK